MSVLLHLMREAYDGGEDRGLAWCGAECCNWWVLIGTITGPEHRVTSEISAATCLDCLDAAREFGEQCRQRAECIACTESAR